jgi:formylglycine-generating enzyme required for sulfatase activity
MTRLAQTVSAVMLALVSTLSLLGGAGDQGDKNKEDSLIVAMKFIKLPKGTFWMGWDSDKKKCKQVEIQEDFEMAAYTVTQEQWQVVMGNNPSWFSRQGENKIKVKDIADADLKRFPVENVTWQQVQQFLKVLNEREQGKGWLYRLPTEAWWEYACRNAATAKEDCSFDFYFDQPTNNLSSKQANFNGGFPAGPAPPGPNLGRPTPVGSYAPNKLGFYDMHGNVWQWCADTYAPGSSYRVVRGGGWNSLGFNCRVANRDKELPSVGYGALGFRLARVPAASNK